MRGSAKTVVLIVLAVFLLVVAAGIVGAVLFFSNRTSSRAESAAALSAEREARQALVTAVVPSPLPEGLPLLGATGEDTDGYPLQYVDRPALRSLLSHARYAELTTAFDQFQTAFEADPRKEYWVMDAADAFYSAEPELEARLDAWAETAPTSFAPFLARGTYWAAVAQARRGMKWASLTAPEHFAAMGEAVELALADLDKALALRPNLVAAHRRVISVSNLGSADREDRAIERALEICPSCFQVRVAYLYCLTPRWGGSYELMDAFAAKRADASNPKMRLLAGYTYKDRANMLKSEKQPEAALEVVQQACALGDHWEFLLQRAEIEIRLKDDAAAMADLDRALALRPGHPTLLFTRAFVNQASQRWEAAGRDLLQGLRCDPTDSSGRDIYETVVGGLVYEGWQHHVAGRREDALRVYDLAAELAPLNREVLGRRANIIGGPPRDESQIEALRQKAADAPDNLRAHQELDYALARLGRFDEVITMWDEYLSRHPDDGRAFLERGGAYYHMQDLSAALGDCKKACDLGISEGGARAKQIEGRL